VVINESRGNLSRTTRKVVLAYARRRARRAYIRLLVWWYARPCHSFNVRRTMLYGRRYVKVVTLTIAGFLTRRVLVDNGSSADIIYLPAYQQMKIDKEQLKPIDIPLVGFTISIFNWNGEISQLRFYFLHLTISG
jgi:hypothetical protein